eukprot:1186219-Prorocentrum_minimum.AAC.2
MQAVGELLSKENKLGEMTPRDTLMYGTLSGIEQSMDGVLEYCGYLAGEWKEESKSIPSNPVGDASQRFSQHNYEGSQLYVNPFRRNELAVYNLSVSTSQFLFQDGGPRLIHTGHQPRTSRATSLFLPLTNMQTRSLAGVCGTL